LDDGFADLCQRVDSKCRGTPRKETSGIEIKTTAAAVLPRARVDNDYLGINPGGTLGAAGLLVDPSLPDGQAAKSCIIAMAVMHPLMDGLSVEQEC